MQLQRLRKKETQAAHRQQREQFTSGLAELELDELEGGGQGWGWGGIEAWVDQGGGAK
jgi:hypothetical protein